MMDAERIRLIVHGWMNARDEISRAWKMERSPLRVPEITQTTSINEFARQQDEFARKLIAEFPDLNPIEWEALLELAGNVRKILNIGNTATGV